MWTLGPPGVSYIMRKSIRFASQWLFFFILIIVAEIYEINGSFYCLFIVNTPINIIIIISWAGAIQPPFPVAGLPPFHRLLRIRLLKKILVWEDFCALRAAVLNRMLGSGGGGRHPPPRTRISSGQLPSARRFRHLRLKEMRRLQFILPAYLQTLSQLR